MSAVERAAEVLAKDLATYVDPPTPEVFAYRTGAGVETVAEGLADALADAGLLATGETRTEWGVRTVTTPEPVVMRGEQEARDYVAWRRGRGGSWAWLMRRTVTTGPWQEVVAP